MERGGLALSMTIAIVYDNHGDNSFARRGSGFSCLLKVGNRVILFDAGAHGPTLIYNLERLGFNVAQIDTIVLSHIDSDHVGGLFKLLEKNWDVEVWMPDSFPPAFKDLVALCGAKVMEVDEPAEICPQVESSGELGKWIKEQALIIKTGKGVILIVGDAHPGIVGMVAEVKKMTEGDIYLVLGGFHLDEDAETKAVLQSFRELGVKKVAPCHSTGDLALHLFEQEYKEDYIEIGVGATIKVAERDEP